jgi:uncharacterized protein with NAD-binding domain and iron-sulfur cluster
MNFPDFEALLRTYPASRIEEYQRAYSLKASLLGKISSQRLVEQEEITKKMSEESKKLKCDFNLAQAANVYLEKKVAKLVDVRRNAKMKRRSQRTRRKLPKRL